MKTSLHTKAKSIAASLRAIGRCLARGTQQSRGLLFAIACTLFLATAPIAGFGADVVLIRGQRPHLADEAAIRELTDFYGLNLRTLDTGVEGASERILSQVRNFHTLAVLITPDVLSQLDRKRFRAALQRPDGSSLPMLVFGISGSDSADALSDWSRGAIQRCVTPKRSLEPKMLEISNAGALTGTLAGLELPAVATSRMHPRVQPCSRNRLCSHTARRCWRQRARAAKGSIGRR